MGAATSEQSSEFANVDANVAANLRLWREAQRLSQDELAQRMNARGFGFSQATIWKIEQGRRPVKLAEAIALADALELRAWNNLAADPQEVAHEARMQTVHSRASQAYHALKATATAYLQAQLEVAVCAYELRTSGAKVADLWTSYLDLPAERAVIEARIEHERQDQIAMQLSDAVGQVMQALREHGFDPVIDLDAITSDGDPDQ